MARLFDVAKAYILIFQWIVYVQTYVTVLGLMAE